MDPHPWLMLWPSGWSPMAMTSAPARRSAYLSRVATNAAIGIARALRDPEPQGFSTAV